MNGKLTDVIIEENRYTNERTGILMPCNSLSVWADKGMLGVIRNIPGVNSAHNTFRDTNYSVYLDPRYDLEWIKAEIEAQIKIHSGGE